VPRTYKSSLSAVDIARLSAHPTERVIVLLRNQHPEIPAVAGRAPVRAAALAADQRPIASELATLHAPGVQRFAMVNAVGATMSKAEVSRLAANPSVLAVVPDTIVRGPSPAASAAQMAAATTGKTAAPAPGVCPANPSQPILEPEALQVMNVDFGPGSTRPAAHDLATGTGVKIAVFPDGLDPNIPDFQRNGKSAIFDYQDFSGEGSGAVTNGVEAFGDASSLISQGTQVFDLSGQVNPAHPLPSGCNIRILGVSPGASVAVMKVFGNANLAFNSEILQGIEYAILHDHVDILSQSFGGNPVPNPGTDPIALLDQQAVNAGVTVVVSSGDAGTTNTIGSPATVPGVISAGASTTYRLYSQTTSYGYQFGANSGWVSNEVSALSSSGDTAFGPRTIDVLAPGEANWSDCSADTKTFTGCADIYKGSHPQPIGPFGGTSESCPFTAGTAALVIQAYRDTHHGAMPSPALVKQIIMSTAQDVQVVANNQGAGLVDALRAVQVARSIHDGNGSPDAAGQGFVYSPTSVSKVGAPDTTSTVPVTVTNTGSLAQTVTPAVRLLGPATPITEGDLTINPATDPTFVYQTGQVFGGVHKVQFTVAPGTDRLVTRVAWETATQPTSVIRVTLFDPHGRIAAHSRPQGPGAGFGENEVHNPTFGTWTMVVFYTFFGGGKAYKGPLHYSVTGARFATVPGAVSPAQQLVKGGASATFQVRLTTPAAPGDLSESVVFSSSLSGNTVEPPLASIPVVLRALVPVNGKGGGAFAGTLTGGNGRMSFAGFDLPYQFDVPEETPAINVDVAASAPGFHIYGFLVDPNRSPVDVQTTDLPDGSPGNLKTLHLSWLHPVPGRWNLELAQVSGSSSVRTSTPFNGTITFNRPAVTASGVPHGTTIAKGSKVIATIHVSNTGNSPAMYSVDPRLNEDTTLSLSSLFPTTGTLPIDSSSTSFPQFVVPPFSSRLDIAATSTVPINMSTSPNFGTPEIGAVSFNTDAVATLEAPDIPASVWSCPPTEIGPYSGVQPTVSFACGASATTQAFDAGVQSTTGNIWSSLEGLTTTYAPLILNPGASGNITVTLTSTGDKGSTVSGFLAVETFNVNSVSSDQVGRFSYRYQVG
jgi:hypothetical protein